MWNYNVLLKHILLMYRTKRVRTSVENKGFGIHHFMRKLFIFDLCTRDRYGQRTEKEGGKKNEGGGGRLNSYVKRCQHATTTTQQKTPTRKKNHSFQPKSIHIRMRLIAHLFAYANLKRKVFQKENWKKKQYLCTYLFDFYLWCFFPLFIHSTVVLSQSRFFFKPKSKPK